MKDPEEQGGRGGNNGQGKGKWRPAPVEREWSGQMFPSNGARQQSGYHPSRGDKKGERMDNRGKPPTERQQREEMKMAPQRQGNREAQAVGQNRTRGRDYPYYNGMVERGPRTWWNNSWQQGTQAEYCWYSRDEHWCGPRRRFAKNYRDREGELDEKTTSRWSTES